MKFTDGFWLIREGFEVLYAKHAQASRITKNGISCLITTKVIENRGDTLNTPTLNLDIDSPLIDVLRIKIAHHKGSEPSLKFDVQNRNPNVQVSENQITSGRITARLSSGNNFSLDFIADGEVFAHQREKSLSIVYGPDNKHYLSTQISLGVGENVYGLGERFTSLIKNGQSIDIWNADGGTSSEQAYKNIPFYLTNKGYGIFVNFTGKVSFEVASEFVERVQFSAETQDIEYYVIYGPTPKEILEKYTELTGRPPKVPDWSFGLWLSTSFVTNYDENTVTKFIDEMARRDIPLKVFHFDCFWMREYQWCDFEWDPRVFPDPKGMLQRLKEKGLRISLWINPYIGQASPLFDEAKKLGYLIKRKDGSVWQWDLWQAGNAIVDFTNPDACRWFQSKLKPLLNMGVDCFKTDFGERIPTDVCYFNGANPEQMHNLYTQLYNKTVWDLVSQIKGEDAILFARSATAGGQKMPVHWGGDNTSTFESMAESLRGGLSLSCSGFGYWSHDIGGFEGTPDPSVFKRWIAFGLLSSHSRLHGNDSVRVPWAIDDESVEITRQFSKLKESLLPYLKELAKEASMKGTPLMRPMFFEFPEDKTSWFIDQQYMLGPDLLVAPIFNHAGEVEFYLPKGNWINYFSKNKVAGGKWIKEIHGFDSLPLYIRENGKYLNE